jgi:hypothetical protein
MKKATQPSRIPARSDAESALLISSDLEANVMELVDCMGFHIEHHVPDLMARLRLDDAELTLQQEYPHAHLLSQPLAVSRTRLFVSSIFEVYVKFARKLRHRLSGPPRLSPQGHWEFSVNDSFGHKLCFTQQAVNQVFTLASDPSIAHLKKSGATS